MDTCCLCSELLTNGQETVKLQQKGSDGINRASEARGSDLRTVAGDIVHVSCRRSYTKPQNIKQDLAVQHQSPEKGPALRSSDGTFNFKEDCLFCGQPAKYGLKRRDSDVYLVRTGDFQAAVLAACSTRNDTWARTVSGRLASVNDLHAADSLYHNQCNINFRTGKNIPSKYAGESSSTSKKVKVGRPVTNQRLEAFHKVMGYLEDNDDCLSTITDLINKMTEYLSGTGEEPYSSTYMRMKVQEHFGERVIMTSLGTRETVITLRETASSILLDFHKQQKAGNTEDEKLNIIKTAAKLIVSDVKSMDIANTAWYVASDELASLNKALEYLPDSLKQLLTIMHPKQKDVLKLASIGQAIVQAIRPRAILAPLQMGLGVQLHHHFSSRFLIDTLREHGFCCSYSEVKRYERSAAVSQTPELIPEFGIQHFMQFVADNVDHNVATLDGKGTFHGMGIISTITPRPDIAMKPIPKLNVNAEDITAIGGINIEFFKISPKLPPLIFQPLVLPPVTDQTASLDVLWKSSLLLQTPRPAWSGMMQLLHHNDYPGESSIIFLPMIDLDPSDPSCIYSTLKFVSSEAAKHDVTPVVTFDQPLYWKALTIIRSQTSDNSLKNIVLRLGGFHTVMSFLGSIGHLMAGSGLEDALELVYAGNSVSHMLTGKAVSRAIRGHMLVDAALNTILIADAYNVPVPSNDTVENAEIDEECIVDRRDPTNENQQVDPMYENQEIVRSDLTEATELFKKAISAEISTEDVCTANVVLKIKETLEEKKSKLTKRTSLLWLQYMKLVDIVRRFLKAERTGNWKLHLQSLRDMLPYMAASGHNLYVKSAHMYLQTMIDLPETHPDVYNMFENGYHVVRRSDRFWAGLSTDLVIEQALMRSLKTQGGLTRGRGMSEIQRLIWILSMPACANINEAMQKLTGVTYETSEQHKESMMARQSRDLKDTLDIIAFLRERDPFTEAELLFNIANGKTAEKDVNVENAKQVGDKILASMIGKSVEEFTFRKVNQAVTLGSKPNLKVKGQPVRVDPQLIFQRLIFLGERYGDLPSLFTYELCSHPPALFDTSGLPLEAKKSVFADAIWKTVKDGQSQPSEDVKYVLDGGALLHRLTWPRGSTYENLSQMYVKYVVQKYGNTDVVFDGYSEGPTTKDATHVRRNAGRKSVTINFTSNMVVQSKRDDFLSNPVNKQNFINLLSTDLEKAGCATYHAEHDADVLIVKTAVTSARFQDTVLVGDDTDLLVLLIYHHESDSHQLFFAPEPKSSSKKNRIWCIKKTKELLGEVVCERILFAHAILGCDTTSRLFGLGKGLVLNKLRNSQLFRLQADVFSVAEQDKDSIIKAGEKALVLLYGGDTDNGLDNLRFEKCSQKVLSGDVHVDPQSLPPSSAAAKYHSMRVYYQIMEWIGETELCPQDWGWTLVDGCYLPFQTDKQAAPSELLDIICCNCKQDCSTRRCSCKRYGLSCAAGCGECHGTSCANSPVPELTD